MLDPMHNQQLIDSAIANEVIISRGYDSVWTREALRNAGFGKRQERHLPGMLIPLWDVAGQQAGYQYRPDTPRVTKDGRVIKYETIHGMRMFLDIHPSQKRALEDPRRDLWITEGIKKGDSLASKEVPCVALMGVWNWRGRNNYDGLKTLTDWDFIALNGRTIYIVFDNDVMTKPNVALAIRRLAKVLEYRKAHPQVVYLPQRAEKLGVDDYLAEGRTIDDLKDLASGELPEAEEEEPLRRLMRLIEPIDTIKTPAHDFYAICPVNGHVECLEITERGGPFRAWLAKRYAEDHEQNEPPPREPLSRVVDLLAAQARFDSEETEHVWTRMGWKDNGRVIYIDMGAPTYKSIQITEQGWGIAPHPLIHFRRPKGQLPLPEPSVSGKADIRALRPFLNVAHDSADEILVWGWLLASFLPGGPYPHLCIHGPQGSAKSTATRLLRSLIDPHEVPSRSMPKDEETLMLAAQNGAVVCLENLSNIPLWLSDILCQLSTGGGLSRRGLYTEEEHFLFGKRPAILNGIVEMVTRGDLRDRCIFVNLERIADENRKAEKDFHAAWEEAKPLVLAALYEAASLAMRCWESVSLPKAPRMADMAKWVMAGIPSFFIDPEKWLEIYTGNQRSAASVEIDASPVIGVLLEYLEGGNKIESVGISTLMMDIRQWLGILNKDIPEILTKGAMKFSRELGRAEQVFREMGWKVERKHTEKGGAVTIKSLTIP